MQDIGTLINLIKAVRTRPKLYTNLTRNGDDNVKEWADVAKECKMTFTEAQDQWSLLLAEYVEYLKNNQDFSLAPHMDFLQSYFFKIEGTENIDEVELQKAIDSKPYDVNSAAYEDHSRNKDANSETFTAIQKHIKCEDSSQTGTLNVDFQKNAKPKAICDSNVRQHDTSFTNMSSLELIFLGYAKQLQKMPLPLQLMTKRKIADVMDEAELQMMSQN